MYEKEFVHVMNSNNIISISGKLYFKKNFVEKWKEQKFFCCKSCVPLSKSLRILEKQEVFQASFTSRWENLLKSSKIRSIISTLMQVYPKRMLWRHPRIKIKHLATYSNFFCILQTKSWISKINFKASSFIYCPWKSAIISDYFHFNPT